MVFKYQLFKLRLVFFFIAIMMLLIGLEILFFDVLKFDLSQWQWILLLAIFTYMVLRLTYRYTCKPFVRRGEINFSNNIFSFEKNIINTKDITKVGFEEKKLLGTVFQVLTVETNQARYVFRSADLSNDGLEKCDLRKAYEVLKRARGKA